MPGAQVILRHTNCRILAPGQGFTNRVHPIETLRNKVPVMTFFPLGSASFHFATANACKCIDPLMCANCNEHCFILFEVSVS